MNTSKKYQSAQKQVEKDKLYELNEACDLVIKTHTTKFDATVEIHINLNIDPKHSDQQVRSTVILPHGTGKEKVIAAFVSEELVQEVQAAGADFAGSSDLVEKVKKGNWTDFDIAVATPDMMREIAKVGKILGTKGLMPNPKAGTVTSDVVQAIKEIKGGKIEYRNDPQGIIHVPVGKVSFGADKLQENINSLIKTLKQSKPSGIKGSFIKTVVICNTMGPGIALNPLSV